MRIKLRAAEYVFVPGCPQFDSHPIGYGLLGVFALMVLLGVSSLQSAQAQSQPFCHDPAVCQSETFSSAF